MPGVRIAGNEKRPGYHPGRFADQLSFGRLLGRQRELTHPVCSIVPKNTLDEVGGITVRAVAVGHPVGQLFAQTLRIGWLVATCQKNAKQGFE